MGSKIEHTLRGLSIGSCFAENIAARMRRAKFRLMSNPFGVLYNPISIASALETLATGRRFAEADMLECNGLWCSFSFHGSFSTADRGQALDGMNRAVEAGSAALAEADYIIITFGTAHVYEYEGSVVANCHKFPASTFGRRRLGVEEIVERYSALIERGALQGKRIIFTVSPVRHIKDGLAENNLSKATLLLAIDRLVQKYPAAQYFPAYEIVMDDLRDYRFFKSDMLHPSETAVDYIWKLFRGAAVGERARQAIDEAEKIADAMEHRPFNPDTPQHKAFRAAMLKKTEALQAKYPEIDWSKELDFFS